MPHKVHFDKGRTHEFLMDRGSNGINANLKLLKMARSGTAEGSREGYIFESVSKNMHLLDMRSRK